MVISIRRKVRSFIFPKSTDTQLMPGVIYYAGELHFSVKYFGDLIRNSAQEFRQLLMWPVFYQKFE